MIMRWSAIALNLSLGLALSLFLAGGGPSAAAAVYKWVDDNGVTHYSQQPRPNQPAKEVEVDKPDPAETERAQRRLEQRLETFEEREKSQQKAAEKAAEQAKNEAIRKDNCRKARAALKTLTEHRRLLKTNDAGERVRMTEEERQAKVAETRKQIDKYCH